MLLPRLQVLDKNLKDTSAETKISGLSFRDFNIGFYEEMESFCRIEVWLWLNNQLGRIKAD